MVSLRITVDNSPRAYQEYGAHKKKPNDNSINRCIADYNRTDNKILFIKLNYLIKFQMKY